MKDEKNVRERLDESQQSLDQAEHDRVTRGIKMLNEEEQTKGYIRALKWVLGDNQ